MAGIFDFKKGAFDSSEAALLHQAYEIALQGLSATHRMDGQMSHRLARSIVKVTRAEPDCLRNDGTIDPVKLAQRAILRMLQTSAPALGATPLAVGAERARGPAPRERLAPKADLTPAANVPGPVETPGRVMLRLFDRTPFAKL
jgi:hypothetical protein